MRVNFWAGGKLEVLKMICSEPLEWVDLHMRIGEGAWKRLSQITFLRLNIESITGSRAIMPWNF